MARAPDKAGCVCSSSLACSRHASWHRTSLLRCPGSCQVWWEQPLCSLSPSQAPWELRSHAKPRTWVTAPAEAPAAAGLMPRTGPPPALPTMLSAKNAPPLHPLEPPSAGASRAPDSSGSGSQPDIGPASLPPQSKHRWAPIGALIKLWWGLFHAPLAVWGCLQLECAWCGLEHWVCQQCSWRAAAVGWCSTAAGSSPDEHQHRSCGSRRLPAKPLEDEAPPQHQHDGDVAGGN